MLAGADAKSPLGGASVAAEASVDARFALAFRKKKKCYAVPMPPAPLADTHAHLMSFWGKEPAEVIARAALAGVRQMTTVYDPLVDERDSRTHAKQLREWIEGAHRLLEEAGRLDAEAYPVADPSGQDPMLGRPTALLDRIGYVAGVHPYGAPSYSDEVHAQVEAALDDPLCRGIGEIGLDYHFDAEDDIEAAPHDLQMEVMARQLELACARNVPVELHVRHEADDLARTSHADAYRVLREVGIPDAGCVLHCFGEDRATMERFCDLGCHIAFGGAATFKRNDEVREAFAACPLDRLLFETDCPYMAPEPLRGLECEPAMIAWTAAALTGDRSSRTGENPEDIAYAVWRNATKLFGRRG